MENKTDAQLVERARLGEHQALAELFRRYWRAARAAACTVLKDLNQAEDVASEALSVAMAGLKGLKEPEKFAPWLHTIVVRTAQQAKHASIRRQQVEKRLSNSEATDIPDRNLEQTEWLQLLHDAVGQLPPKQREAVMLFYFEGYTVEQAANFLGVPAGTLKRRLHDGRKSLRHAVLQWIQLEALDLRAVEQRLRDLIAAVVPDSAFSLIPYSSPRYRSGLRMQFKDSTLPAAAGGVLEPWPGLPEDRHAGMLVLCLEAWASALSGQDIELDDAKPFLDLMKP